MNPLVFVAKDQHELRKRRFVKKWKCNKKTNFSTNWCTSTYHYVLCNISNNLMNSELLICFLEKYCNWKSIRMYHFYFEFIQFFLVVRIIIIYSFLFWGKTKTNILDCWGMISRCKRFYRTSLGLGCAVNFFEKRELKQQFYPNQNMQYLFLHLEYRSSWIKVLNIMYVK